MSTWLQDRSAIVANRVATIASYIAHIAVAAASDVAVVVAVSAAAVVVVVAAGAASDDDDAQTGIAASGAATGTNASAITKLLAQ